VKPPVYFFPEENNMDMDLISEEEALAASKEVTREVQRTFTGVSHHTVRGALALISLFIIYSTINMGFDVVIKYASYLMLIFVMTAVIYPFRKKGKLTRLSVPDVIIIILSIAGSIYVMYDYNSRFMRLGMLTTPDIVFGVIMVILGLDIGRRVIGWSLTIVSLLLIVYALYGNYIPGHFGHRAFSITSIVSHIYAGLEGFYGISSRMMIIYVAPFIIMGAFLERTGGGEFFIRLAFALTRRSVGGPAKAAVVGSAFLGSISGSAIANVSSTGVFTIPMMKKIGYKPHVAGAIEAAASTGGQIMPPIMGAVAFIMAEFTQIPYLKIVGVAVMPIMLYYITLIAFVHIEAKKNNIRLKDTVKVESALSILKTGWHFFFTIVVIVVIMAFGYPPNLSALGGILTLVIINVIKHRKFDYKLYYDALVLGGKYSLSIGSLVACIGIILSMVGLTGVGLKFSWLFTTLSRGSFFLAIVLVGLISLILGMGLASSAAYIVTAVAVGPALITMGFPLMAAHFIMIWFSIDSEITPPVGLASIVGAGIARADAMKTMFTAFKYAKGLYILPFMFYFRPGILLQDSFLMILETGAAVLMGLLAFVGVWENYLVRKTSLPQRVMLAAAAGFLFVPGVIWNGIGVLILGLIVLWQMKFPGKKHVPAGAPGVS